ncbi:MAG: hypothetical protein KJ077_10405 [Anaerolineae bacterium]|nr:hypothetical protein [Anaerolineae bacterium]
MNKSAPKSAKPQISSTFIGLLILHEIERYQALGLPYDTPSMRQLLGVYLLQRQREIERFQKAAVYKYALDSLADKIRACRRLALKSSLEDKRRLLVKAEQYFRAFEAVRAKFTQTISENKQDVTYAG